MPNLTTVGLTAGAATSGTGTVSTLDNVIGVAGTPSAQVQTVQGVTSMTPLKVDPSAVTSPVSATQTGTWTVQPGNTANTTAWKVDGSAVTQPVSGTVTANIGTGLTKGAGVSDASTARVTIDSTQLGSLGIAAKASSVPSAIATDQPTLSIAHDTTQLMKGATGIGVTPVSVAVVASSSGATSIVAAQGAGNKIRVIQWDVKVNAAVNFKWQSAANDLTGLYYNSSQGDGVARSFSPVGYFTTNANEALNINLSGAVALGGSLTYVVVT